MFPDFLSTPTCLVPISIFLLEGSIFHGYMIRVSSDTITLAETRDGEWYGYRMIHRDIIRDITTTSLDTLSHEKIFLQKINNLDFSASYHIGDFVELLTLDDSSFDGVLMAETEETMVLDLGIGSLSLQKQAITQIIWITPGLHLKQMRRDLGFSLADDLREIDPAEELLLERYYEFKMSDHKQHSGFLFETRGDLLQFLIMESGKRDGWLIVPRVEVSEIRMGHSDFFRVFLSQMTAKETTPPKSLQHHSLRHLCTDGVLCEISARSDGYLEDFGELFWISEEYRFYPIEVDGTSRDDGYLPLQESDIISLQYHSHYLKSLEQLEG